jgi:hypothetical protein
MESLDADFGTVWLNEWHLQKMKRPLDQYSTGGGVSDGLKNFRNYSYYYFLFFYIIHSIEIFTFLIYRIWRCIPKWYFLIFWPRNGHIGHIVM